MDWNLILHLASIVLGAIVTGVPILIKWNMARVAKNNAKTESEKKQAQIEMAEQANQLIKNAEITFSSFDKVMKAQNNGSAGALKKESVINSLQAFAISKGYEFDSTYWSEKIDEIVAFTKQVNNKH